MSNVIAVIPAENSLLGSTKKNLALINGTPLIKFTIDYAKSLEKVNRVIVATNDKEIANYSKKCGAEVPFLLSDSLCRKGVEIKELLKKTLELLKQKENYSPDFILFLEATHPFRKKEWADRMISLAQSENLDRVFLAKPEKENFWKKDKNDRLILIEEETFVREKKQPLYKEIAGLGSVIKASIILEGDIVGENSALIPINFLHTIIDIKTKEDLFIAEQVYNKYFNKIN